MGHSYSTRAWKNEKSRIMYQTLIREFGAPSIPAVNREGGMAIWYENKLKTRTWMGRPICFSRIILMDEALKHACPEPHTDYLYFYFRANPTAEQFMDTKSISESIGYDGLQKHYWVRCNSIGANVVVAKLISDILVNKVSLLQIRTEDLYLKTMRIATSTDGIASLYSLFCKNLADHWQSTNMTLDGHWSGAFLQNCVKPLYDIHVVSRAEEYSKKEHFDSAHFLQKSIGSDIQNIDSATKDQKQLYPKYTDFIEFGISTLPSEDWKRINVETSGTYTDTRASRSAEFYQHDVGSRMQDITGLGGTVAQKINYPKYVDFLQSGIASLPTDDWTPDELSKLHIV